MEQRHCLKCFLTKTGVLVDWKRWSKNWQHWYCCSTYSVVVDITLSAQPLPAQYLCCQFFFGQCFQSTKTPVFVRKHFKQSLCSIILIFSQRFDQVLIFTANSHHWHIGIDWRHNCIMNSKEYVTNVWTIFFRHL